MRIAPALFIVLSACANFPALEGTIDADARDAPYPALTPVPVAPAASADITTDLQTRVTALQTRAVRIRRIDIAALQ